MLAVEGDGETLVGKVQPRAAPHRQVGHLPAAGDGRRRHHPAGTYGDAPVVGRGEGRGERRGEGRGEGRGEAVEEALLGEQRRASEGHVQAEGAADKRAPAEAYPQRAPVGRHEGGHLIMREPPAPDRGARALGGEPCDRPVFEGREAQPQPNPHPGGPHDAVPAARPRQLAVAPREATHRRDALPGRAPARRGRRRTQPQDVLQPRGAMDPRGAPHGPPPGPPRGAMDPRGARARWEQHATALAVPAAHHDARGAAVQPCRPGEVHVSPAAAVRPLNLAERLPKVARTRALGGWADAVQRGVVDVGGGDHPHLARPQQLAVVACRVAKDAAVHKAALAAAAPAVAEAAARKRHLDARAAIGWA